MRINKEKLKGNLILLVIFSISILGLIYFSRSFAVYVASGESNISVDLAFSLLNVDELEKEIKLNTIKPDSTSNSYSFSVANYEDDKLIDINMEYDVVITTTTNLPMHFGLYDWDGNLIESTADFETDEYGTIFYKIKTNNYKMGFKDKQKDLFKIVYKLDDEYDSAIYQDIIELLSVKVEARQV